MSHATQNPAWTSVAAASGLAGDCGHAAVPVRSSPALVTVPMAASDAEPAALPLSASAMRRGRQAPA